MTRLLPRDSKGSPRREQICWINGQLEHWCNKLAKNNVLFLKPDTDWTKPNGQLREDLYYQDLLHLSEKGNCKFSRAIINILTQKPSTTTTIMTNQPPSSPTKTYTTSTTTTHINTSDIITTEVTSTDITANTLNTGTPTTDTTTTDITTADTSTRDTTTTDL